MKKLLIFVLIVVLIYALGGIIFYFYNKDDKAVITKNIAEISGYTYTLKSNATQLLKNEFSILKTNLESDEINEEEFAKSIAKLFIIDLYTINNKLNKYDVGGIDYVIPLWIENYKLNVQDTIYKYVEDNSNKKRTQELPEVSSIEIITFEETSMKINNVDYIGYKINLNWSYIKDMEYDNEGEVIVLKDNNHYYVAEKN